MFIYIEINLFFVTLDLKFQPTPSPFVNRKKGTVAVYILERYGFSLSTAFFVPKKYVLHVFFVGLKKKKFFIYSDSTYNIIDS